MCILVWLESVVPYSDSAAGTAPQGGTIFYKAASNGAKKKQAIVPDQNVLFFGTAFFWHRPQAALEKIVPPFGTDARESFSKI